ncbi:MAG: NAD(P)H-dependent oxidoreductase [Gammaproteobacteria bacterium]|nr:NAD(P)H-dependent oxidoreductase [Gammaproteobacteria bacterium]MBU1653787.1 NAD(P)H-dependent oxidoreductase [Gammaproteobacteria bacterium]MBU1961700.1 NAD(P)H-dependent oxidoreductase [Gammaproteobacteria bacterium]
MARILLLFVHPFPHRSRVSRALLEGVCDLPGVEVVDLYEQYPDFHIDIKAEQRRILDADLLVVQHPFYWYSAPALFKQWQDRVLEYGFAFGGEGGALRGKDWLSVVTTGQGSDAYRADGHNGHSVAELLFPFACSAHHCGMNYLEPIVVYGASRLSDEQLAGWVERYRQRLADYRPGRGQGDG